MDKEIRDKIFMDNVGLVIDIAVKIYKQKYQICKTQYIELEDIKNEGYIGLLKAIDRFDERKGFQFSTFAVHFIRGEILRFFRDDACLIRQKRPGSAKDEEERINIHSSNLRYNIKSINEPIKNDKIKGKSIDFKNTIGEDDEYVDRILTLITVENALNTLPEINRSMIKDYFFNEQSQIEIAEKYNVSQVTVSRTIKRSFNTIRNSNLLEGVIG